MVNKRRTTKSRARGAPEEELHLKGDSTGLGKRTYRSPRQLHTRIRWESDLSWRKRSEADISLNTL